jgi:hypothetical protein
MCRSKPGVEPWGEVDKPRMVISDYPVTRVTPFSAMVGCVRVTKSQVSELLRLMDEAAKVAEKAV